MNIEQTLKLKIQKAIAKLGIDFKLDDIIIETTRDPNHGDFASNIAMQNARALRDSPRNIAQKIIDNLDMEGIEKVEIAGPGFLNFFVSQTTLSSIINVIKTKGETFGDSDYGQKQRVNVEFVSANPTGDLHLGHARGAAIGDVICRLYAAAGYDVTREYYVNDAGNQIDNLALSLQARYHQAHNRDFVVPENGYHGPDLIAIAQQLKNEVGDKYLAMTTENINYFKQRGIELELSKINRDLDLFRVHFDVFSYETNIRKDDAIANVLSRYAPYTYVEDGATFLKTTAFGDDKDRVIIKSDGSYTYFLPDIAYHLEKLSRNFVKLIDVLGADHHGYIARMKAALAIAGYPLDTLDVEIIQLVRLVKDGAEFKMSKRTGLGVTLRELCEDVGVDAVRYYFVARAASTHLDFDLDLATEASSANPVYYAQYAHARLMTVINKTKDYTKDYAGDLLITGAETDLLKHLAAFPAAVLDAAITRSPYKVTTYVQKLASLIHGFYSECRLIDDENLALTNQRLALVEVSQVVIKKALNLVGVSAPEKM